MIREKIEIIEIIEITETIEIIAIIEIIEILEIIEIIEIKQSITKNLIQETGRCKRKKKEILCTGAERNHFF